ncbi:DEAD/DEAH box helicase [Prolixibacteraceae bacterium JC049]|nr:DEAD/DEAH box helicase [Prolixibacteraceae bacterium JC049]
MKLKKLAPELAAGIIDAGFDKDPRPVQSASIPKIKSGADVVVLSPENTGKSVALLIGVMLRLKKAEGEAPRAIVLANTKEQVFALEEQFNELATHTNLRTFSVFDQGIIQYQKDMIYEGLDVLFGTPKRINELMSITGIPMINLKVLAVDDAETLVAQNQHPVAYRIADGAKKLQCLLFATHWHEKFDDLEERMLKNPIIIEDK